MVATVALGALAVPAAAIGAIFAAAVSWGLTRSDENGDALIDSVVDDINSAFESVSQALDDVFGLLTDFINNGLAS